MADCSDVLLKELGSKGGQIVKLRIAIQRYKNQVNYNCNQRHKLCILDFQAILWQLINR